MSIFSHTLRMAANKLPPELTPGTPFEGGYFYTYLQFPDGVYAMIIAPKSSEISRVFSTGGSINFGSRSELDGAANTAYLTGSSYPAVVHCKGFYGGGFSDWYLGAKYEMLPLYRYLKPSTDNSSTSYGENPYEIPPVGNFPNVNSPGQTPVVLFQESNGQALVANSYQTSTVIDPGNTNTRLDMINGSITTGAVSGSSLVRPIRKVKVN